MIHKAQKFFLFLLAIGLGAILLADSASLALNGPSPLSIKGQWRSDDGSLAGEWSGTFQRAGDDISGTLSISKMPGVVDGEMSGLLQGDSLSFGIGFRYRESITFRGQSHDPLLHKWSGQFTTVDGLSGTWNGQLQIAPQAP